MLLKDDMSQAQTKVEVLFQVKVLNLTETECRALDALVGYGDDAFLDVFGKGLGQHYMRDYEEGLRQFFSEVRRQIIPALKEVDDLRSRIK